MSVTFTLPEPDARGCSPLAALTRFAWKCTRCGADPDEVCYASCCTPSVRWLVSPEPIVCERCKGTCVIGPVGDLWDCLDCDGTGLPTVQIVSDLSGYDESLGRDVNGVAVHGTVTIGKAVPIGEGTYWTQPSAGNIEPPCITINSSIGTVIFYESASGAARGVTDEFGSQPVTPTHWAHPIEVTR